MTDSPMPWLGGSIKDRIALSMIMEAEKRGEISRGR